MSLKEYKLIEMLLKLFQDDVSDAEIALLEEWFLRSPDAVEYYWDFVKDYVVLTDVNESAVVINPQMLSLSDTFDSDLWKALAEVEHSSPCYKEEKPKSAIEKICVDKSVYQRSPRSISKFSVFSIIMSIAAVIFVVLFVRMVPVPHPVQVATLIDQIDAQWASPDLEINDEDPVYNTDMYRCLRSGIIKLRYSYGTEVIVEGPANFRFPSEDEFELQSGRVFTRVPRNATGFTLSTPTSNVIDLGTEFGVKVDVDGTSDVCLFKGEASLVVGPKGKTEECQMLEIGKGKRVDFSFQVKDVQVNPLAFVRNISSGTRAIWRGEKAIDLADIVGGGNGLGTGQYGYIVDQSSGKIRPKPTVNSGGWIKDADTTAYRISSSSPFIDGIFVPDGENEAVQISSQGHQFKECPDTGGDYWIGIQNGGLHQVKGEINEHMLSLGGVKYGTRQKPAIFMHANQGITFDLKEIRQVVPFSPIARFVSFCGLSDSLFNPSTYTDGIADYSSDMSNLPIGDFWVLVDGELRFSTTAQSPVNGAASIDIQIFEKDRFLTIVATDSNMQGGFLWALFAEPKLILGGRR